MTANRLKSLESEFALEMTPMEFSQRVTLTITTEQSRQILKSMGINIPARINTTDMNRILSETPKLTPKQIDQYYQKVSELVAPKKGG